MFRLIVEYDTDEWSEKLFGTFEEAEWYVRNEGDHVKDFTITEIDLN
jgi:hypothetical protein